MPICLTAQVRSALTRPLVAPGQAGGPASQLLGVNDVGVARVRRQRLQPVAAGAVPPGDPHLPHREPLPLGTAPACRGQARRCRGHAATGHERPGRQAGALGVAGIPANLVPAALIPAICALGYALHRRGR